MILKKGFKGTVISNLQKNLNLLGFSLKVDGDFGSLTEYAVKSFQKQSKIKIDGVVGEDTQRAISLKISELKKEKVPWMDWLIKKIGWNEIDNDKELSVYWKYTNVPFFKTTRGSNHAWCAMIICAALEESGFKSPRNAAAISFDSYGIPLIYPIRGCIITVRRTGGSGRHVTIFSELDKNGNYKCIGGNQSNEIDFDIFKKEDIVSIRWPLENELP